MTTRAAPKGGYDFGNKRQYRRNIWSSFRRGFDNQVADKHVLLLPSLEGDEIDVALAAGFREQRLHVVDENPAIVATLKRRYPRINTYGVPVVKAAYRMARQGIVIHAANLDLCGKIGGRVVWDVAGVCASGVLAMRSLLAVTCLRGRESKDVTLALMEGHVRVDNAPPEFYQLSRMDHRRISQLMVAMGANDITSEKPAAAVPFLVRHGIYWSRVQTMLWVIVTRHEDCKCWECERHHEWVREGEEEE